MIDTCYAAITMDNIVGWSQTSFHQGEIQNEDLKNLNTIETLLPRKLCAELLKPAPGQVLRGRKITSMS
jgi:hypothetical protein